MTQKFEMEEKVEIRQTSTNEARTARTGIIIGKREELGSTMQYRVRYFDHACRADTAWFFGEELKPTTK